MANEKIAVVMRDGRKVEFGATAKIKKDIILLGGHPIGIRFDAVDGDVFFADFQELPDWDWVQLGEAISRYAMAHGYSQKLGDEYANLDAVADCMEAARALWAQICGGKWAAERQGFNGAGILLEAAQRVYPDMTKEEIRVILQGMKAKEREALKQDAEFAPHIAAIQMERSKGVDTSALKAKFNK